jgi:hypothetical protein
MEVKLINGSWVQTMSTILNEINIKLDDTEIADIIKRIDDTIADEEMLELLNRVVLIISNTQSDITLLRLQNNFLNERLSLLEKIIKEVKDKENFVVVREIVIKQGAPYIYKKSVGVRLPYTSIERKVESDETFVIDQTLVGGYMETVVELTDWGIKYLNGTWLINGNRRKLITNDIELLKKYGL